MISFSIESIDKEVLVRAVFAVLFDFRLPESNANRQFHVRCCSIALDGEHFEKYIYKIGKTSLVDDALTWYGAPKMAKECAALWRSRDRWVSDTGVANIVLLLQSH